ncbi:VC0807 family protein [Kitasatospora sp. MAP5-34]|uniref:VC0807 family protein n=1 Tax=Kitasatospora sp. MAP5-34 TaxID=3035102 RepID=UPI002474CCD6|nr:VC0807 family protein [Kitasatospora sp. MAP5-34]MDH6577743.1 hypothetical protein [Kitasatospora sp. MAP5-34]
MTDTQTASGPMEPAPPAHGGFRALLLQWGPSILFSAVLPVLTYNYLKGHHHSEVSSLIISGLWPAVETLVVFLIRRHIDEMAMIVLTFLALGLLSSVAFNSPRLVLVKDSALTGLFGLVLFASLLAPRPLCFYFGRKFATDGSPAAVEWWNGLWKFPAFRHNQKVITIVWGTVFVGEAVLRIVLTYLLSVSAMVTVNAFLPFVALFLVITWTIRYGKRAAARGAAARAAAGLTS